MLTVYAVPVSLYCAKLRIVLRHKKLDWREEPPPGGYGSDDYKRIVPSGNLPALRDGELLIADSEAIAEYLNEKHPDSKMLPDDMAERAAIRERSRFHDTHLEPEVRKLFPHISSDGRKFEIVSKQSTAISERPEQFSRMLTIAGKQPDGRLWLGDCGYPVTFLWIDLLAPYLGLAIEWPDDVRRYRDIVGEHSAVADELSDYRPKLETWLRERKSG